MTEQRERPELVIVDNWAGIATLPPALEILGDAVGVTILEEGIGEDELVERCQGAEIVMPMYKSREWDARLLDRLPALRHLAQTGGSSRHIDVEHLARRGGSVSLTRAATYRSVAEFTIGLLLSAHRMIPESVASLRRGEWVRYLDGHELRGRTLGIVGYGQTGSEVAKLASGLGMRPLIYSRHAAGLGSQIWDHAPDLPSLFAEADDVSLHTVLEDSTREIIKSEHLRLLRGGVLVNTSRAGLVRTADLLAALDLGAIGVAAIDVHDVEPPPREDRLVQHPRVIATPHIAGGTTESHERYYRGALENVHEYLRRRADPVPREEGER